MELCCRCSPTDKHDPSLRKDTPLHLELPGHCGWLTQKHTTNVTISLKISLALSKPTTEHILPLLFKICKAIIEEIPVIKPDWWQDFDDLCLKQTWLEAWTFVVTFVKMKTHWCLVRQGPGEVHQCSSKWTVHITLQKINSRLTNQRQCMYTGFAFEPLDMMPMPKHLRKSCIWPILLRVDTGQKSLNGSVLLSYNSHSTMV